MKPETNQRWMYVKGPVAEVGPEHYQLVEEPIPSSLADNEVLLANRFISVDPYMRVQQSANNSWEAPIP